MLEYINIMTKKYRNNCFAFENRWTFFAPSEIFGHCVHAAIIEIDEKNAISSLPIFLNFISDLYTYSQTMSNT